VGNGVGLFFQQFYWFGLAWGNDWVKKCTEYEVEDARPRGRPKKTWTEIVQKRLTGM